VLHKRAHPTWADAAYLTFYLVALAGILSFPRRFGSSRPLPGGILLGALVLTVLTGPQARVAGTDGKPVSFMVSIGIAESAGCADLPALLALADLAMYEAKRAGGGCWRAFEGTGQVADAVPGT
jgi:GGDEF domain-containing protein